VVGEGGEEAPKNLGGPFWLETPWTEEKRRGDYHAKKGKRGMVRARRRGLGINKKEDISKKPSGRREKEPSSPREEGVKPPQ